MKNFKILLFITLAVFIFLPHLSLAVDCQPGFVRQNGECVVDPNYIPIDVGNPAQNPSNPSIVTPEAPPTDSRLVPCTNQCDFTKFITLISTVIHFVLFDMAVPIAAIMFAYAGFLMVTSGGSTEAKSKAKKIFTNVALGLIIAIAAWLIIHTILSTVGFQTDIGF